MSGKLEYRKILRFPNLELTEYQVTSEVLVLIRLISLRSNALPVMSNNY